MGNTQEKKPKQGRQKAAGRIDPAIELALRNIREAQVGEIDPYSMTTRGLDDMAETGLAPESDPKEEVRDKNAVVSKPVAEPRRGRGRPRKDPSAHGVGQQGSYLYVSAERKHVLETMLMCYRLSTGKKVTMSDFVLRYVERGLEAEEPKVMALYRKFVKASE